MKGNVTAARDFLATESSASNTVDVTVLGPDEYGQSGVGLPAGVSRPEQTLEDVFARERQGRGPWHRSRDTPGNFMGRPASVAG